ncbi:MAG TPA: hypothetical protein DEF30_11250 [Proteiniclasticum sp.]|uniref:hypothetical protein n=1 Tax=Proteiniclasticum sp. TaxID=2053595 RepID=UPI000E8E0CBA|nr:hypothetical protein [Proteiniclasticum sp.]HBW14382.1 hypothetical protein [Proteiniclasticum sp.]
MKSDREFLDGIYQKAEQLDPAKTISQEENVLLKSQGNRRKSYFSKPTLQLAGSFAVLALVFFLQGVQEKENLPANPVDVPRVISRTVEITEEHPLFTEATDILEVEVVKNESQKKLRLVGAFRSSEDSRALEDFLLNNELGILEGKKAVLFLKLKEEKIQVLDVFYWEEEVRTYLNAYRESLSLETLEETK